MNTIDAIKKYECFNEQEEKDKKLILKCCDMFDDIFSRKNELIHMTSSIFAINESKDSLLMVHHNIFNSWSWTGGHADGETDLLSVAVKELKEETGINKVLNVCENIVSLDIIPVKGHFKNGSYVSPHLHISVAFLIEVDESEELFAKEDENKGVQWIPIKDVDVYSNEEHMISIYHKIAHKLGLLN